MGRRVLLVEGKDDQIVLANLLEHHKVPQVFEIRAAGSDMEILQSLPTLLKASDLERLAVLIDADTDLAARWQSLATRISRAGYTQIPQMPWPNGTILHANGLPLLGLWLMPNNTLPGILEDFLAFLVPQDDTLLPHVDAFLDGLPVEARRFAFERHPKARIHAWLAVQNEPGKPLGQAITARYLDADRAAVVPLLEWLRKTLVD